MILQVCPSVCPPLTTLCKMFQVIALNLVIKCGLFLWDEKNPVIFGVDLALNG